MFDPQFLALLKNTNRIGALREFYLGNKPFPHIVLEQVFSEKNNWRMFYNFPPPNPSWWEYKNTFEKKLAKDDLSSVHESLRDAVAQMQSRQFTDFLEGVTGISGLIVDQTLRGAGLHQILPGGKLDVHVDHTNHSITSLDRRLNVLLYLNEYWHDEWNGHLEFWSHKDGELQERVKRITPTLGRMVIFGTTDSSYHGHPDPLKCPEGITRKSIALYYYTNGRPAGEVSGPHSVIYARRPTDPVDPETEQLRELRAKGVIK